MEKRVTVRLSQADFDALQQEAEAAGGTIADTLRSGWRRSREAAQTGADLQGLEERLAARVAAVPAATVAALSAARRQ